MVPKDTLERLVGQLSRAGRPGEAGLVGVVQPERIPRDAAGPGEVLPGAEPHEVPVDGLVDHVPCIDASLVTTDHGVDVRFHPAEQCLANERLTAGILEHRARHL